MQRPSRNLEWIVWGGLGLTIVVIAAAFFWKGFQAPPRLPVYGQVPDFVLTNQLGNPVSPSDLRGKVWLADIIFTLCGGPCPELSRRMADLNTAFAGYPSFRLVSLTADPAHDTPPVLRVYADRFNARPERWFFLTGPKKDIYELAVKGLKLAVVEKETPERTDVNDLFIHSTFFTLVDQQGRLRGFYSALEPGTSTNLVAAIKSLLNEK